MTPLVNAGRVFTVVPPLHRFKLTKPARAGQFICTYSDADTGGRRPSWPSGGCVTRTGRATRASEMDADQLAERR